MNSDVQVEVRRLGFPHSLTHVTITELRMTMCRIVLKQRFAYLRCPREPERADKETVTVTLRYIGHTVAKSESIERHIQVVIIESYGFFFCFK
ncbi:hypothetical protein SCLCIDRAFT_1212816, partial [Scleroderma citrinum Foug A]